MEVNNCYRVATVKSSREKLCINQHTGMLALKYKRKCPVGMSKTTLPVIF